MTDVMIMRRMNVNTPVYNFVNDFGYRYMYNCVNPFASGICMSALSGDSVAMASYYRCPPNKALQIFTLSAATGQMTHNQYCGQYIAGINTVAPPQDMAYEPFHRSLMLIDTLLQNAWRFYDLDAYPTTWMYVPQYYYYINDTPSLSYYTSLYPVSTNGFLAAKGAKWFWLEFGTLPAPLDTTHSCIRSYTTDMFTVAPYVEGGEQIGVAAPHQIVFRPHVESVGSESIYNECN